MDDYNFDLPIDYSIGTPVDFGSNFTPESIYDLYNGNQTIGSYAPDINASSEDWLNYFQEQPGTNGWDINTSTDPSIIQKLLGGNMNSTLGALGSAALMGTNMYQDYQSNELQQEALKQQARAAAANLKNVDANIYKSYTTGASDETTNARDNLLLRQYMDQTQPYNMEREMAILGKGGVDTGKLMALRNAQQPGRNQYVNELLGYENQFKGYGSDLINMRDQDQLYNGLKPTQGALNAVAVSQPPQTDYMSTIPQGADPMQIAAYHQYLTGGSRG